MLYIVAIASLSCFAGVLGGITGTGGILIPPVLIECFGVSPHIAMGTAQASYVIPSMLAVGMFIRKGQLDKHVAVPLSLSGSVCTFASAAWLKPVLDGGVLTFLLGLCIVTAGVFMLSSVTPAWRVPPRWRTLCFFCIGGGIGVLTGVTGSGGNAILVPLMVACGVPILTVLAACQAFSILASGFGTIGNLLNGAVDLHDAFWLVIGQLVGIWLGVSIAQRLNTSLLRPAVGIVCLGAGVFVLFKAFHLVV